MPPTGAIEEKSTQHRLSDFLYAELLHTLGAYGLASEKLDAMYDKSGGRPEEKALRDTIKEAGSHNQLLREWLHHPNPELEANPDPDLEPNERRRHPSPIRCKCEKPLCRCRSTDPSVLNAVYSFYGIADHALGIHLEVLAGKGPASMPGAELGELLARIHDPQRRTSAAPDQLLVKGRRERTQYRLKEVEAQLKLEGLAASLGPPGDADFGAVLNDCLDTQGNAGRQPLHVTILKALSDAHKWMHQAEHLRSQTFGAMFTKIPETHAKMETMLKRSIVLNTFVYFAARSVPWVFAENNEERHQLVESFESFDDCCRRLTPTYCMWIGNQLGLVALERRAYTWWTLGRQDLAYSDFHKLIRLLRVLRRQIDERGMRVPGTKTLVEGLTATAEHHIGRIYRSQHAHRVALRYLDRATKHLDGWEDHPEIGGILKNSRWRVNLLINRGKANYELGRTKASLLSYARAWRAFLQLAETESHSTANIEMVKGVIEWLESIEDEPELSKAELSKRIEPLVTQFETVYSPMHLRLLGAEIMMRLGHLLYLLKLPPLNWTQDEDRTPDHELARRCMFQAAELDRTSTLIATDLLKIRHGARLRDDYEEKPYPKMAPLEEQWPAGGGRFEEAVRMIEYVVQTWLEAFHHFESDRNKWSDPKWIAHELLRSFLAHTDSSNVKLAQVYRYLMQPEREVAGHVGDSAPTIEVVCLRRYSSFFPFLPRPAAFHALGGGYLVQVREENSKESFGIAIDPGPNFLENLYRCGYALADIHMIVLTHDHADHIASVDALLALMATRGALGGGPFSNEERLAIVGNESVVERYRFFNEKHPVKVEPKEGGEPGETEQANRGDAVRVMSFEQFHGITKKRDLDRRRDAIEDERILVRPDSLRIVPIKTIDHDDARGYIAQGFLLTMGKGGRRSSVLFTGDTGRLPRDGSPSEVRTDGGPHLAAGRKSLEKAVDSADVVVAHLSSIPLPELRRLAELAPTDGRRDELAETFKGLWGKTAAKARSESAQRAGVEGPHFLLRQLQFAFRTLGKGNSKALDISPVSALDGIADPSERHLYLAGLLDIAERLAARGGSKRRPLLLIGELREELGTFRTRIASHITKTVFNEGKKGTALTTDIGLRIRVSRQGGKSRKPASISVLCTTCDLDNDLIASERFHPPDGIREVCVKGENEGVFYNCELHDPGGRPELLWVESVERYNVFGD